MDLEPCTGTRLAGFSDRYPGDQQDLPAEIEPKAGMFPVSPLEEPFFILFRDPRPVILADNREPAVGFMRGDADGCQPVTAINQRILDQVVKDLLDIG